MPSGALRAVTAAACEAENSSSAKRRGSGPHAQGTQLGIGNQEVASLGEVAASLLLQVVERRTHGGDQRHRGRVGAFALGGRLALLAQIEVVARLSAGLHASPGALAGRQVGKARRNHQRLLRAADDDVNAIAVHVECGGAESGDGVDDEQRVGSLHQLCQRRHIVAHAGGGFRGLHKDGLHVGSKQGLDFLDRKSLAVGLGEHNRFAMEGLCERDPALAELSRGENQNLIAGAGEIADRGFHGSGAGGGEHDHVIAGTDEDLQLRQNLEVERPKLGRAVMKIRCRHGKLRRRKQRCRAGGEETSLTKHEAFS